MKRGEAEGACVLGERENKAEKPFQILMSLNSRTAENNWVKRENKQVCWKRQSSSWNDTDKSARLTWSSATDIFSISHD